MTEAVCSIGTGTWMPASSRTKWTIMLLISFRSAGLSVLATLIDAAEISTPNRHAISVDCSCFLPAMPSRSTARRRQSSRTALMSVTNVMEASSRCSSNAKRKTHKQRCRCGHNAVQQSAVGKIEDICKIGERRASPQHTPVTVAMYRADIKCGVSVTCRRAPTRRKHTYPQYAQYAQYTYVHQCPTHTHTRTRDVGLLTSTIA